MSVLSTYNCMSNQKYKNKCINGYFHSARWLMKMNWNLDRCHVHTNITITYVHFTSVCFPYHCDSLCHTYTNFTYNCFIKKKLFQDPPKLGLLMYAYFHKAENQIMFYLVKKNQISFPFSSNMLEARTSNWYGQGIVNDKDF